MKKLILAATALCAVSTPALAKNRDDEIGRYYFIYTVPSLHPGESQAMTTADFDALKLLENACWDQRQNPSVLRSVLIVAARNAPGAVAGGAAGAALGNFTQTAQGAINYGIYNGVATVGNSIGAGLNAHAMANMASFGGCMVGMVARLHQLHRLQNVIITYNTFPTRGHAIRRSSLAAPTPEQMEADSADAHSGDSSNDSAPPPPHQ